MEEHTDQSLEWEMMRDKYGSINVEDIVRSPLFLADFQDWIDAQEHALAQSEFVFLEGVTK